MKACLPPVVRADARVLVLGSLPGERSLAERRYYAHPQNQFWRLIAPAAGRDLADLAYDERLAALAEARIALWDVVAAARRTGSADASLRDVAANDLPALVAALPDLRAIGFNGATAARIGRRALEPGPALALIDLPSSSPLHTVGLAAKLPAWEALAGYVSG